MKQKKKMHWTQTPEGRKRATANLRRASRIKRNKRKEVATNGSSGKEDDHVIAYALGHVESWLETYARSHGVSAPTLTYRVGQLLQRSARRQ